LAENGLLAEKLAKKAFLPPIKKASQEAFFIGLRERR
jgi:hypothetical protein